MRKKSSKQQAPNKRIREGEDVEIELLAGAEELEPVKYKELQVDISKWNYSRPAHKETCECMRCQAGDKEVKQAQYVGYNPWVVGKEAA